MRRRDRHANADAAVVEEWITRLGTAPSNGLAAWLTPLEREQLEEIDVSFGLVWGEGIVTGRARESGAAVVQAKLVDGLLAEVHLLLPTSTFPALIERFGPERKEWSCGAAAPTAVWTLSRPAVNVVICANHGPELVRVSLQAQMTHPSVVGCSVPSGNRPKPWWKFWA